MDILFILKSEFIKHFLVKCHVQRYRYTPNAYTILIRVFIYFSKYIDTLNIYNHTSNTTILEFSHRYVNKIREFINLNRSIKTR